jgi:hypothetical protein
MLWVMAKYAPPIHKGQGTLVLPHAIWPRLVVFLIVLFHPWIVTGLFDVDPDQRV